MAKIKDAPISQQDIQQFVDSSSDFGFELRVLARLKVLGISCDHGGTYNDPVTKKPRQFDIRAEAVSHGLTLRMAIECKNLRPNFPLVVLTVPRAREESYHELLFTTPDSAPPPFNGAGSVRLRITGDHSFYPPGDPVGKSCSQVGRALSGELTGNDSEVYEKWYQAIHSAHGLLELSADACDRGEDKHSFTFVLPVLVVPNKQLWEIQYSEVGERISDPAQTDRVCFYIDKLAFGESVMPGTRVALSHLEMVTESGLVALLEEFSEAEFVHKTFFSREAVENAVQFG